MFYIKTRHGLRMSTSEFRGCMNYIHQKKKNWEWSTYDRLKDRKGKTKILKHLNAMDEGCQNHEK